MTDGLFTRAVWSLVPNVHAALEVTWGCAEGGLPAVLVALLGSPSLLWGHAAPAPLEAPGLLCLLSRL